MKISVIQPGARLHYAVPAIFARAGLLRRLYTDLHAEHGFIRAANRLLPLPMKPKAVRRLLGRRLPEDLPPSLVHDRPIYTLAESVRKATGRRSNVARVSQRLLADLEKAPLGEGDTVYTVLINEDVETMRRLKARGVRIVHECMLAPDVGLILAEEHAAYPGFGTPPDLEAVAKGRERDKAKYAVADMILVPSEFVREQVIRLADDPSKIRLVPYGFDTSGIDAGQSHPVPGQVLFVGSVGLRKGSHYLAAASRALPQFDFRVAGPAPAAIVAKESMLGPSYLGQVPRSDVFALFRSADLFAFPTLCEGMALVHLEAMAHGVPVVTTPGCGSVVRDGIDGFVVPLRDTEALVGRISQIVEDRQLRDRMSRNARQRAEEFSRERYANRLLDAMREI